MWGPRGALVEPRENRVGTEWGPTGNRLWPYWGLRGNQVGTGPGQLYLHNSKTFGRFGAKLPPTPGGWAGRAAVEHGRADGRATVEHGRAGRSAGRATVDKVEQVAETWPPGPPTWQKKTYRQIKGKLKAN